MSDARGPECLELEQHLSAYIDGELSAAERLAVATHLEACSACRNRYGVDAAFVASLRHRGGFPPVPGGLRRRILDALREEDRREKA